MEVNAKKPLFHANPCCPTVRSNISQSRSAHSLLVYMSYKLVIVIQLLDCYEVVIAFDFHCHTARHFLLLVSPASHQIVRFHDGFVVDVDSQLGLAHERVPKDIRVPHLKGDNIACLHVSPQIKTISMETFKKYRN